MTIAFPSGWEGKERGVATLEHDLRALYRAVRDLEHSILNTGGDAAHFLGVVDREWVGGENADARASGLEGEFSKLVSEAAASTQQLAKALAGMMRRAKAVSTRVDEMEAQRVARRA